MQGTSTAMIKFFSTLPVIFMLAAAAFSQSKSNEAITRQLKALQADKNFELIYDKASNSSKLIGFSNDFGKAENKRNNLQSFRFGLAVNYAGNALATVPDAYLLTFQAGTKKEKFRDAHRLEFTVDNVVLDLGEARYGNKNQGVEYLNFVLDRHRLVKIAGGREVRMKAGSAEFTLKPEQIKMFADLLALSDPSVL